MSLAEWALPRSAWPPRDRRNNCVVENEQPAASFFQRFRVPIIIGAVVLLGGLVVAFLPKGQTKKKPEVSMVNIMPPLPPPPPPPPTPPPQEPPPEPDTKPPEFQPEEKPVEAKPEPPAPDPAPALGSNIQGDGPNAFGLSGGGNGVIGGSGKGNGGGGTKWGWYAGKVQTTVVQGLRSNRRTKSATLNIKVRVWVDSTGRVTRAVLSGSSGDPAVDRAIQNEVLNGLQLPEPPPDGMPMPIVMRITAQRPN
jgi:periplasmic protein TonB